MHLNSNQQETREPLQYTKEDIKEIEKWSKLSSPCPSFSSFFSATPDKPD